MVEVDSQILETYRAQVLTGFVKENDVRTRDDTRQKFISKGYVPPFRNLSRDWRLRGPNGEKGLRLFQNITQFKYFIITKVFSSNLHDARPAINISASDPDPPSLFLENFSISDFELTGFSFLPS